MEVYREILPESYLLVVADDTLLSDDEPEKPLRKALSRAARSGKISIWIDCSQLEQLPPQTAEMLARYCRKLDKQGISLILCHLSEALGQLLLAQVPELSGCVLPTLLDAEQHCGQQVNRPRLRRQAC
jgi:anti-anti-sigma regulatory factor